VAGRDVTSTLWESANRLTPDARSKARTLIDTIGAPFLGSINGAGSSDEVAITFDDGPEPTVTPHLLALLREHKVQVTFFVLLTQCRRYPELLEAIVADGHEIALHGVDHRRITGLPYGLAVDYLSNAKLELEQTTGQSIDLYRPPYGSQSVTSWNAVRKAGMQVVAWSCDGADWVDRDVESVVADSMARLNSGGILLLHERLEPDPQRDAPKTSFDRVEMTHRLLDRVSAKGWKPAPVGKMVSESGAKRTVWLRP